MIYHKKLCMNELSVEKICRKETRIFEQYTDPQYATLTFLQKGQGRICTTGRELKVFEGQLLYLPEGERYDILWTGKEEISFIRLSIVSRKFDIENTDRYEPQVVEGIKDEDTESVFQKIFQLFETEDRMEKIRAIGHYYLFYADLLPRLEQASPLAMNPFLREAISLIDLRFSEDFSMEELAKNISLSPSRMFHLFQKELGITPTRYRNRRRVEEAAVYLRGSDESMAHIAERCGFHSTAYFREIFKSFVGKTPQEYRGEWRK